MPPPGTGPFNPLASTSSRPLLATCDDNMARNRWPLIRWQRCSRPPEAAALLGRQIRLLPEEKRGKPAGGLVVWRLGCHGPSRHVVHRRAAFSLRVNR